MSAAGQVWPDSALALVRAYATGDAGAVSRAVAPLDETARADTHAALGVLLRSTLSVAEVAAREIHADEVVRRADALAPAAPPHYEFAITEAVRAWAALDPARAPEAAAQDPLATLHVAAVFLTALGQSLWGEPAFLHVLTEYERSLRSLHAGEWPDFD
ncbi:hypothetical protein [Streptomyces sp. G45]|uniref:hypothetical protein n=1 Tax=Streptomyces sp. G45 TaxID=3406627 RepID=UPI003C1FC267